MFFLSHLVIVCFRTKTSSRSFLFTITVSSITLITQSIVVPSKGGGEHYDYKPGLHKDKAHDSGENNLFL